MGRWLEHTVTSEVSASADRVWQVWSDLEAMPKWMRWIESVKTLDDPDLTDWTLAAQGFRFSWRPGSPSALRRNSSIGSPWVDSPPKGPCASTRSRPTTLS